MRIRTVVLLVATAAALPAQPLLAQRGLQIGAAVRVSGLDVPGTMVEGLYAGMLGDTVLIGVRGGIEAVRIPRQAITHLEVKFGRRSGAMRASLLGMYIGTGVGVAGALVFRNRLRSTEAPGVILGGAALGAVLGGAIGHYVFRADRWVETPLDMLDDDPRSR